MMQALMQGWPPYPAVPMKLTRRPRNRPGRDRSPEEGQTLVEFSLVFPMFFLLLLGLVEFAFVFNALLAVNYGSRDAALAAAEAGDAAGADCVILDWVENAIGAPADTNRIQSVEIYQAKPDGTIWPGTSKTVYTRAAPRSCTLPDGTVGTVPYGNPSPDGYPPSERCNVLGGCNGAGVTNHPTVDNVVVRITYTHDWVTPLQNFAGGGSGGLTFDRSSVMRMEPVL
jgi:Flp pilus assembly protein TadG